MRDIDPYKGFWHLPGGTVYKGEKIQEAAVRTAFKETGLKVVFKRILGVDEVLDEDRGTHTQHTVCVFTEVEVVGGELKGDFQSKELRFFKSSPEDTVPIHKEIFEYIN